MINLRSKLETLSRPDLLVRAARYSAARQSRERALTTILGPGSHDYPQVNAARLLAVEAELEEARVARLASYSIPRHITVLAALTREAELVGAGGHGAPARPDAGHPRSRMLELV